MLGLPPILETQQWRQLLHVIFHKGGSENDVTCLFILTNPPVQKNSGWCISCCWPFYQNIPKCLHSWHKPHFTYCLSSLPLPLRSASKQPGTKVPDWTTLASTNVWDCTWDCSLHSLPQAASLSWFSITSIEELWNMLQTYIKQRRTVFQYSDDRRQGSHSSTWCFFLWTF